MRTDFNPRDSILSTIAFATIASYSWGYVNGGDYHNTLVKYEKRMRANGWGVCYGEPIGAPKPPDGPKTPRTFVSPDEPEHEAFINRLVGQAVAGLPQGGSDKVSLESKREIARLTREAIKQALTDRNQVVKSGKTGSVRYEVGVHFYEAYWETNYGGKRETHARRTGFAPVIAVKVAEAEAPPER